MGRRDVFKDYEVGKDGGWSKKIGTGTKERERTMLCEALRDGYVLCEYVWCFGSFSSWRGVTPLI